MTISAPDHLADLDLLMDAAHEAGRIARGFAQSALNVVDKPGGAGPVTDADLAVNAMLETRLRSERPDYGWLSEETEDGPDRQRAERTFIIDPIDGTRSFIKGERTWAHSLAVATGGTVTAAVVFLPMRDEMFTAAIAAGAYKNGQSIRAGTRAELPGATVLSTKPSLQPEHWPNGLPDLRVNYRPSLAYRLCAVAEGKFDAMITFRPSWEWDIAAGDLILREAGALTSDKAGGRLVFNNPHPQVDGVIAAGPALYRGLHAALGGPVAPAPR